MPRFEIAFCDGKTVVKTTDTPDEAKTQAKAERTQQMPRDTPRSAPEVKVARVTRLVE